MKRSSAPTVNQEQPFDISELFFSTTDEKGRIKSCNEVFLKIAEFEPSELLGAPHSIIRHPDMPRCVFFLLWEYLLSGRAIGAYVKNRAHNGNYYWVFALASPIEGGFLSVRIKPTSPALEIVRKVYADLLHIESSYSNWRDGMKASADELMVRLKTLGFDTYDDFMGVMLHQELKIRTEALAGTPDEIKAEPNSALESLRKTSSHIEALLGLRSELQSKEKFFSTLGIHMARLALNASIRAARLGENGHSLGVVSQEVSRISKEIETDSGMLKDDSRNLAVSLGQLCFFTSQAILQLESIKYFEQEQAKHLMTPDEQTARYGDTVQSLSGLLLNVSNSSVRRAVEMLTEVRQQAESFDGVAESLEKILLTLRFSYVTGKTLTASVEGGEQFGILLNDMMSMSDSAQEALLTLKRSILQLVQQSRSWQVEAHP